MPEIQWPEKSNAGRNPDPSQKPGRIGHPKQTPRKRLGHRAWASRLVFGFGGSGAGGSVGCCRVAAGVLVGATSSAKFTKHLAEIYANAEAEIVSIGLAEGEHEHARGRSRDGRSRDLQNQRREVHISLRADIGGGEQVEPG
jgi:hypothetical protein